MRKFTHKPGSTWGLRGAITASGLLCSLGFLALAESSDEVITDTDEVVEVEDVTDIEQGDVEDVTDTEPGEEVELYDQYSSEYYANFTYTWEDEDGVTHTSNLSERAVYVPQMIAMLKEVYTNPEIPGFVEDHTYYVEEVEGELIYGSNYDPAMENTVYKVPYRPCTEAPYYMPADMEIPTPREGATALMIELKDDYEFNKDAEPMDMFNQISAISIMPHSMYIGRGNFDVGNHGWLFNYIGVLDKFFIITKGNNRITSNSDVGFAPFYFMFEEFSPSNKEPISDAYASMNAGEQFAVDHNCASVLGQNHIIEMSPANQAQEYPMNFMFYLPDNRFEGDSRKNIAGQEAYEWYTYYSADHMPFFFFNKIKAAINEQPAVDSEEHTALVKLEWRSTYKDVTQASGVAEQFYIYRVVDDVIQPDPVTDYSIPTDKASLFSKSADGMYITKMSECVAYIPEQQAEISYDVKYIVKGRRDGSTFEFTESNIVTTTIPGYSGLENLNIMIDGAPKSTHMEETQENVYANKINLSETPPAGGNPLLAGQIRIKTADVDGTIFRLMRYTDNPAEAEQIAEMEVVERTNVTWSGNDVGVWKYTADIRYTDSSLLTDDVPLYAEFRSGRDINGIIPDEDYKIEAVDAGGGMLARFVDSFKVSTHEGKHPTAYHYYMTVETTPTEQRAAAQDDKLSARSNVVDVAVPVRQLKVGYIPYTAFTVDGDTDYENRLSPNPLAISFETRSNPLLTSYTIRNITKGKTVVSATRMPTGTLEVKRLNAAGNMETHQRIENSMWITPVVELQGDNAPGDVYSLVLKYENGNTYGNIHQQMQSKPHILMMYAGIKTEKSAIAAHSNDVNYSTYCEWGLASSDGWLTEDTEYIPYKWHHWGQAGTDGEISLLDDVEVTSSIPVSSRVNDVFSAHSATEDNPVQYTHYVRAYYELPESMRVSNDEDAKLAVYDNVLTLSATDESGVTTGIEGVMSAEDVTYRYFDITGVEYREDNLPSGIIICIGSDGSARKFIR